MSSKLEIPFGVKVVNPKPVDSKLYNNVDTKYTDVSQVLTENPLVGRYQGQTFLVDNGSGVVVEYWFKDGTSDVDLIIKTAETTPDKTYVHDQQIASTAWTIVHSLNKYPNISIVSSSGDVVYGNVAYTNPNQCVITFSAAFSGKVYCN